MGGQSARVRAKGGRVEGEREGGPAHAPGEPVAPGGRGGGF